MPCAPALPPMLRAEDIRAVGNDAVEWGSHTASHGFLDRVSDAELEREVSDSKQRLEAVTSHAVRLLAFPNGYYDGRAGAAVERAGYMGAFTVRGALIGRLAKRFEAPRFDVGGHPTQMLKLELTGVLESLRRLRAA